MFVKIILLVSWTVTLSYLANWYWRLLKFCQKDNYPPYVFTGPSAPFTSIFALSLTINLIVAIAIFINDLIDKYLIWSIIGVVSFVVAMAFVCVLDRKTKIAGRLYDEYVRKHFATDSEPFKVKFVSICAAAKSYKKKTQV